MAVVHLGGESSKTIPEALLSPSAHDDPMELSKQVPSVLPSKTIELPLNLFASSTYRGTGCGFFVTLFRNARNGSARQLIVAC